LIAGGGWWIYARQGAGAPPADSSVPWLIALFTGLLVGSAFASSSEIAIFSLDKLDLSQLRNSRRWADRATLRLLDRPNDTLITILLINNFFNIAASLTSGALMGALFARQSALTFTLAAALASVAILFFAEILPKVVAHLNPQRFARLLAPPLAACAWLLTPVRLVLGVILKGLFRLFAIPEHSTDEEVSEEELKVMISSGEVSQVLEKDEREMIDGVFDLRRTVAAEVLTPRLAVNAVPDDLEQEEMIARLRESPNNRVLVYHESLDHVIGFVLVKEVLLDATGHWRDHLREPLLVPEGVGLLDLLKMFRQKRTKIAILVDEYGGMAGIVTLQDLLEEIVGDIYEKHEHDKQDIAPVGEDEWRVAGTTPVERLAEEFAVDFPPEKGRTVGGFVMNTLGRIPEEGDEVIHETLSLTVEKMIGRRLQLLRVRRRPVVAENAAAGEGAR
jgi:CBS domain containing-hemolysin-like protein